METLLSLTLSGSALALLLLGLKRLLGRRLSSTVYYYAWLLVLLRLLLPLPGLIPLGQSGEEAASPLSAAQAREERPYGGEAAPELPGYAPAMPEAEPAVPAQTEAEEEMAPAAIPAQSGTGKEGAAFFDWRSPRLWLSLWGLGAACVLLWQIGSYLRFRLALRHTLRKPGPELYALYARIPGRKPPIYLCQALNTPLMFGVFSPRILLPTEGMDETMAENILRHELCHYRRFDPLYKWFAVTVLALHWFNPLAWLIRRELNRACELSCDEVLLRRMDRAGRQAYGETLLKTAAGSLLPAGVVATTFSTEKRDLKERLEQIMHTKNKKGRVLAALLALVLLCGCAAAAGPAREAELVPRDEHVIHVSTVDEFLEAILPNATIVLEPGDYDLSTASDYGKESANPNYAWVPVPGSVENTPGYELQIRNVEDLTIRSAGMEKSSVLAVPRFANVLVFRSCPDLRIEQLRVGHTDGVGLCSGGVVRLDACTSVTVDQCGLFGCGTVGVVAQDCAGLTVSDCRIYDCSQAAVELSACRNVLAERCEVEQNGTKSADSTAVSLFSAANCQGVTILDCLIHENDAQILLNAPYSKEVRFLSNRVEQNRFGSCLFRLEQYSVTVDGCAFTGNDSPVWIQMDGNAAPINAEGRGLGPEDLAAMDYRLLDPATVEPARAGAEPLELPAGGNVMVETVDEFLAALGPDRTIVLDGERFDLADAVDYGGAGGRYYYWRETPDGPELVIAGVSGLTIRAAAEEPAAITLCAEPRYANVLRFQSCDHLSLSGFTAGHTLEPGGCMGGVVYLSDCHELSLYACRLYGCGVLGLSGESCTSITAQDCEIYECSLGAVDFSESDGIRFLNCSIHDVPSPALRFFNCGDLSWNDEPLLGRRFDLDQEGKPVSLDYDPARDENPQEGGGEGLYPFDLFAPGDFPEDEKLAFAREVQHDIARGDWEALSGRLRYPFHILTGRESVDAMSREDFLALDLDALLPPSFRLEVGEAPLDAYGISYMGNTFCGGKLAFARVRDSESGDDLRLTCISPAAPLPDDRNPMGLQIVYYTNVLSEFTLSVGESVTVNAQVRPVGLFPDAEISWTVSDPEAIELRPGEDGRFCTLTAKKTVPGGVVLTARFGETEGSVLVYLFASQPAAEG